MSNETPMTICGNLTADPELRFTAGGDAVANFTIASTPRQYDKQTGEWRDQEALFLRCSAWRQLAENISESLYKGARVVAQGRLRQRSYENRDGEKRSVVELTVDDLGASLRTATAALQKTTRPREGASEFAASAPTEEPPF